MRLLARTLGAGLLLAGSLLAQPLTNLPTMPTCADGAPRMVWVLNGAGTTDCSVGGGTDEVLCCCDDAEWSACSGPAGTGAYFFDDADYIPAGSTTLDSKAYSIGEIRAGPTWFRLQYVDSTRVLTASWSRDGMLWEVFGTTTTLSADPITWGYLARESAKCRIEYLRLRTDANRDDCGE